MTQPGLLRKAKKRIHRYLQAQGRLYAEPVVVKATDLLAEVWAAGRDIGVTEEHWDRVVASLPAVCLNVAQRSLEDQLDEE